MMPEEAKRIGCFEERLNADIMQEAMAKSSGHFDERKRRYKRFGQLGSTSNWRAVSFSGCPCKTVPDPSTISAGRTKPPSANREPALTTRWGLLHSVK
jgi:hypothetical protein